MAATAGGLTAAPSRAAPRARSSGGAASTSGRGRPFPPHRRRDGAGDLQGSGWRLPAGLRRDTRAVRVGAQAAGEPVINGMARAPPEQGAAAPSGADGWGVGDSRKLYNVEGWGSPYFGINADGDVTVRPLGGGEGPEIALMGLIGDLRRRNISLPLLLRFPDILRHRLAALQACFDAAIDTYGYEGAYQGVFPVKCNHDRYLIEDVLSHGDGGAGGGGYGLEAGSKPELLIAISQLQRAGSRAPLVCNGYKDEGYVETVLLARRLGIDGVIVLEQLGDLRTVLAVARRLGIPPVIGVRAKLATRHAGHWGGTSGDGAKFGLSVGEILAVVRELEAEGMLDCLRLLHFHIGSQIPSIATIKETMREASHLYCELARMGAPMGTIDVGGGLGISYDGSKDGSEEGASTNYDMQNYANDVVAALRDACSQKGVPCPTIASESGRALASHHAVLVFEALSAEGGGGGCEGGGCDIAGISGVGLSEGEEGERPAGRAGGGYDPGEFLLKTFWEVREAVSARTLQETYNDAIQFKQEAVSLFKLGLLSLEQRAAAENLFADTCDRIIGLIPEAQADGLQVPEEVRELFRERSVTYHVNLSIFRSAPDTWAIGQLFPVLPLHRLAEKPEVSATLADLTCDSDGKIDRFIGDGGRPSGVLPLHPLPAGSEPYVLGLFLGGVYQEVMGSNHNLFGATNAVHIGVNVPPPGGGGGEGGGGAGEGGGRPYTVQHVVTGEAMEDVLKGVQHSGDEMVRGLREAAEAAVGDGRLSVEEAQRLVVQFERSMGSYTYLNS